MSAHSRFDSEVLPHLDAAYNLARWLTRSGDDAEDVVQDACVRALRYAGSMRSGGGKAWFLTIVRHAFYDWAARNRPVEVLQASDEWIDKAVASESSDPEKTAIRKSVSLAIADALTALPLQYREVIVLRELEDLSYRDIARTVGVPVGTVMSRLARARAMLRSAPSLQAVAIAGTERKQS